MSIPHFQCSICKKLVPAGKLTAFQTYANGQLHETYKCHACQEALQTYQTEKEGV